MSSLSLFEGVGIELEYMIVSSADLSVRPIADVALRDQAGDIANEVEHGDIAWSNELASHVVELKTNGPAASTDGLAARFAANLAAIDERLAPHGARLLGTAAHPWMDPHAELVLWPHDDATIYLAFDRIFGCRGHGWANLQSMHVNLPFSGDDELRRLHSSIRAVLPILPALAASSPALDGRLGRLCDARLAVYRTNCQRVPSVTGLVVPEVARSRDEYEARILQPIYDALAEHDPEGVLRHEWVNARGAIARFDRMAVEIRVIDVQEHPGADLAIAEATIALVRALSESRWAPLAALEDWPEARLAAILDAAIEHGDAVVVDDADYLRALGWPGARASGRELWLHLRDAVGAGQGEHAAWWRVYQRGGCLAGRIRAAARAGAGLPEVYRVVADCLRGGLGFAP